ncbi:MAG: hypothetical protein WD424_03915 [Paenibacillaceae bacterium]
MMMFILAKIMWISILLVLIYIGLKYLIISVISRSIIRSRLSNNWRLPFVGRGHTSFIHRYKLWVHLSDLLESVSSSLRVAQLLLIGVLLAMSGVLLGTLFFSSVKGVVSLGVILALIPYISLRMRLLTIQMRSRINFLPAMEVFYQSYILSEHKNIRMVLKASVEENRMLYPIKGVFEQLYLGLMVNKEADTCLRVFALTLGNQWADHYISILRFGLIEGVDLSLNLKELIGDMRKAQRMDQVERNRLLEIRIANFSPIVFLIVFMVINFRIDADNAYAYYVVSEVGRDMLLDAIILIGASFLMGIYLSMRRM